MKTTHSKNHERLSEELTSHAKRVGRKTWLWLIAAWWSRQWMKAAGGNHYDFFWYMHDTHGERLVRKMQIAARYRNPVCSKGILLYPGFYTLPDERTWTLNAAPKSRLP